MSYTRIRIEVDDETLARLRELAAEERRATTDQAALVLTRAMQRRKRRQPPEGHGADR